MHARADSQDGGRWWLARSLSTTGQRYAGQAAASLLLPPTRRRCPPHHHHFAASAAGFSAAKLFSQGVSYTYDDVIFLPGHIHFGADQVRLVWTDVGCWAPLPPAHLPPCL